MSRWMPAGARDWHRLRDPDYVSALLELDKEFQGARVLWSFEEAKDWIDEAGDIESMVARIDATPWVGDMWRLCPVPNHRSPVRRIRSWLSSLWNPRIDLRYE